MKALHLLGIPKTLIGAFQALCDTNLTIPINI